MGGAGGVLGGGKAAATAGAGKREVRVLGVLNLVVSGVWKFLFGKQADGLKKVNDSEDECTLGVGRGGGGAVFFQLLVARQGLWACMGGGDDERDGRGAVGGSGSCGGMGVGDPVRGSRLAMVAARRLPATDAPFVDCERVGV